MRRRPCAPSRAPAPARDTGSDEDNPILQQHSVVLRARDQSRKSPPLAHLPGLPAEHGLLAGQPP
ncbi:hypothetical protein, partial [Proteus mirabilis]|uniref:hypothetical protein n=1 Tax=Proteus mirabilis TaxID=584 RepID=UPI001953D86D